MQLIYAYTLIKPCQAGDTELYSLILNVHNPLPKILTSQKLSDPLSLSGFISFHGLVILDECIQYSEYGA